MGRVCGFLLGASLLTGQTTQGLITGRVLDDFYGTPLPQVSVSASAVLSGYEARAQSDAAGRFTLPDLSPGKYHIRLSHGPLYQAQTAYEFDLHVASSLIVEIRLRRLADVLEKPGQRGMFLPGKVVVVFFGPDVDTTRSTALSLPDGRGQGLEATLSHLASRAEIDGIPLAGRDTYTFLSAVPGVTFDTGSSRGLGYAVNGQRPSSSSFLLDGLEFNNYLVTGPLTTQQPESVEEYRVSTSNFSPEFGRTAGYLANAVTRSGGAEWHGLGYLYGTHQLLHAAEFQREFNGLGRRPYRELQPGFHLGGPVPRTRVLFVSASYEHLRLRTEADASPFSIPGSNLRPAPGSVAESLFNRFRLTSPRPPATIELSLSPRVSFDRDSWNSRLDAVRAKWRWMTRLTLGRVERPDLLWSPFEGLSMPLKQPATQLAGGGAWSVSPHVTQEFRAAASNDQLSFERPSPEIPAFGIQGDTMLPASPGEFSYRRLSKAFELVDNVSLHRGRHAARMGAGLLERRITGSITPATLVTFSSLGNFALDRPGSVRVVTGERGGPAVTSRNDAVRQFHFYAQDAVRLTSRIAVSGGFRYDDFGRPDVYSIAQRNWSGRAGVVLNLGPAVVRAGYGFYLDRLFDNLWENVRTNSLRYVSTRDPLGSNFNYLRPAGELVRGRVLDPPAPLPDGLLAFSGLRTPLVRSGFVGAETRPVPGWSADAAFLFSEGESLPTTDQIQRNISVVYRLRESRGTSGYRAANLRLRHSSTRGLFQVNYLLSRSRDLQSEPLQGELFNQTAFGRRGESTDVWLAAFPRAGDPAGLYSWSDYDQRHSLLAFGALRLPRKWTASLLASARSGFPFSALAQQSDLLLNRTVRQVAPTSAQVTSNGSQWLARSAFSPPGAGQAFGTARNAFRAPGLLSADLSAARAFPIRKERWTVILRGDCFNFLNHANLGPPVTYWPDSRFGQSLRGRSARPASSPVLAPLDEAGRRLQILLRLEF